MSTTVLFATHNGAHTLPRVLDAYMRLHTGGTIWQLVIVDNASTDETPQIISSFTPHLPLRAIRTEKRGKNVALNIGIEEIDGELVILTDDDAVPATDWLVQLIKCAAEHPEFDIFGGGIDPIWPEDLPEWIPRLVNLGATFAITPSDTPSGPICASQIWGPNMAIRSKLFAAGHRFNEAVGPTAGQYIMGSEVEFTCRLERLGHKAWFCGDARVGHIVRQNQISRKWIVDRAFRLGRHMYHQERPQFQASDKLIRGAPRWKYRRLVSEQLRHLGARLLGDQDRSFLAEWEVSFLRGYLHEAHQHRPECASRH